MKGKAIIIIIIIAIAFISGICMLVFGLSGMNESNKNAENYIETQGYLSDYSIYYSGKRDYSYRLIYSYTVDGVKYSVMTEYGTGMIPQKGSTRTVKYNKDDPSEAVLSGGSSNFFLIFMGVLFIGVPSIIIIAMLSAMGYLKNLLSNVLDFAVGFILIAVGFGSLYLITGGLSFINAFKSFGAAYTIPLLIVLLFTAVGFLQLFKCIVTRIKKLKDKN